MREIAFTNQKENRFVRPMTGPVPTVVFTFARDVDALESVCSTRLLRPALDLSFGYGLCPSSSRIR